MKFADYSRGYILKLEKGEELLETLGAFVAQKRLPSAFFQGIGTIENVELGYFNSTKKTCIQKSFNSQYELLSLSGNVSIESDIPFVHAHVVLSDDKFQSIGGHLLKGTVTLTAEIFLFPVDMALIRKSNEKLNFKELELPHQFVRD